METGLFLKQWRRPLTGWSAQLRAAGHGSDEKTGSLRLSETFIEISPQFQQYKEILNWFRELWFVFDLKCTI